MGIFRYMKRKEFYRKNGHILGIIFQETENQELHIEVPYKTNTRTKIHEISHIKLGHTDIQKITMKDLFMQECEAEHFTAIAMNKKVDARIIMTAIADVYEDSRKFNTNVPPNYLIVWAKEYLNEHSIPYTKGHISNLWGFIKEEYNHRVKEIRGQI